MFTCLPSFVLVRIPCDLSLITYPDRDNGLHFFFIFFFAFFSSVSVDYPCSEGLELSS